MAAVSHSYLRHRLFLQSSLVLPISPFQTPDENFLRLLRIRIKRCIDVAINDFKSSDPYAVVRLGKQVFSAPEPPMRISFACSGSESSAVSTSRFAISSPMTRTPSSASTNRFFSAPGRLPTNLDKQSPVVVFAHGAGAPSTSDWMIRWKEMMGKALHAVEVVTFDYPYMAVGKKLSPMAETLVDFHADVVKKAISNHPGHPLILAGKSMGSRASCMVAGREDVNASAVVCLGYPLKGMKGAIRDEILVQLTVPIMFVQGSKDGLFPLDKLKSVQKKIKPLNELYVVEGGDHSLKVAKKHLLAEGSTQEDGEGFALEAIAKISYSPFAGVCFGVSTSNLLSLVGVHRQLVNPLPFFKGCENLVRVMGHLISSPSCEESKKKNMRDIGKGAMDLGELLMAYEMEEAEIQRSVPFTYQFNGQSSPSHSFEHS